jgi:hypothetical protein
MRGLKQLAKFTYSHGPLMMDEEDQMKGIQKFDQLHVRRPGDR